MSAQVGDITKKIKSLPVGTVISASYSMSDGQIRLVPTMADLRILAKEIDGRCEWLSDLKETILDGKLDIAVDNISAAIKLLSTSTVGGDDRRKQSA